MLCRTISMLFVAQAFCQAAGSPSPLMRKKANEQVAVLPDGEIMNLDGASDSSLLSMYEGKSAQKLLEDVQALVKNGGDEEGIETIQKLVDEELIPGLQATHKATQDEVNVNLDAIKSCNTASTTKQNTVKSDEQSTDTARKAHAACREEEKNKNSASSGRCKELDDFLNGINSPASLPGGRAREEMVKYVETVSSYFCPSGESKGDEVTKLDDACTAAEAERAKHQAECTSKQTQFESDFCTWRAELTEACDELGTCYATAVEAWKTHREATKPVIENWKVEFKSLHKIKCYVSVFMNDNDAKTVDASQYEKCKGTEADDSAMDIDFGTPADKIACDLSPVATYPGTEAFPTTEYSAFSDLVAAPLACLQGSVQASEEVTTATAMPEPAKPSQVYSEEGLTKWTGWSDNSGLQLEGRYCHGKFTGAIEKTIENLPAHKEVSVKFRYYALESWDPAHPSYGKNGNEVGRFYADGTVQWKSKSRTAGNCKNGWLDMSQNFGSKGWKDCYMNVEVTFAHTGGKLSLKFDSNLDQNKNDEAWAMDNLMVTTK